MGWTHKAKLIRKEIDFNSGTNLGKGNFIFVGSSTDMWGRWIQNADIHAVLAYCYRFDNKYLFQTKDPGRFQDFSIFLPKNSWLCTTIETNRNMKDIANAPAADRRAYDLQIMREIGYNTTLTMEPIMDFDLGPMLKYAEQIQPDWISIGADSKNADLPEPPIGKVRELIDSLTKAGFEVKIKKNFKRLLFKGKK